MILKVKKIDDCAVLPKFAHDGDACFDISILIDDKRNVPMEVDKTTMEFVEIDKSFIRRTSADPRNDYNVSIKPRQTVIFHTGLKFETEHGYNMKIHVRSSTGIKKNLLLSNGTGVIDTALYRGEVLIALTNVGDSSVSVRDGERVAQGEIVKNENVQIVETIELSDTERGDGGFGSTGGH